MSYTGWSSSNFLRLGSAVLSGTPLSMVCWAYTTIQVNAAPMGIYNSAVGSDRNEFKMVVTASNTLAARTGDGSGSSSATTSATVGANAWYHLATVFASATSRAAYINGANKATNATSRVPSGLNRTSIGREDNTSGGQVWASGGTGYIAEAAIYNIALSDADVATLALGVSPLLVHPEALVCYWPMMGGYSPAIDPVGRNELVIQGSLSDGALNPAMLYYPANSRRVAFHSVNPLVGNLSTTLGTLTLSSGAKLAIAGALNQTLGVLTVSAAAQLKIQASLAATLDALSVSAAAQLQITGALSATLDALTLSAAGELGRLGSLDVTLGALVLSASGNDGWTRLGTAGGAWTPVPSASPTVWTPVSGSPTTWTKVR